MAARILTQILQFAIIWPPHCPGTLSSDRLGNKAPPIISQPKSGGVEGTGGFSDVASDMGDHPGKPEFSSLMMPMVADVCTIVQLQTNHCADCLLIRISIVLILKNLINQIVVSH